MRRPGGACSRTLRESGSLVFVPTPNTAAAADMSSSASQSDNAQNHCCSFAELRLVVLGPKQAGSRAAVCAILGLEDQDPGVGADQECSKHRGEAAGRQVVVVSSPAWFSSACDPEERRKHISSLVALSSPGPHAFLLCVSVNQPVDDEIKALAALDRLFGAAAVSRNTLILFTHTEELGEDEELEEYLVTWRKDLLELVARCGDRYHTLESRGGGGAEERSAVEELLVKVERAAREGGTQHLCSCPLYQEAEERLQARQMEIVRQRREDGHPAPTNSEAEVTEEEMEAVREEAERSVGGFDLDLGGIFTSSSVSPSSPAPSSFLGGLWEKLVAWIRWLPSLVRREALMGALVGLFVGGPIGGMVGATVGSVATEVGKRKTEETEKTK